MLVAERVATPRERVRTRLELAGAMAAVTVEMEMEAEVVMGAAAAVVTESQLSQTNGKSFGSTSRSKGLTVLTKSTPSVASMSS